MNKTIKRILAAALTLALFVTPVLAETDEDGLPVRTLDEVLAGRVDLTDQFKEEEPEEDPVAKAIREKRVDLTDNIYASDYGYDELTLASLVRTLLGFAVPVSNTLTTIQECQTCYFTSEQKLVKVAAALGVDVLKKTLPTGIAGQLNTKLQNYINAQIRAGALAGGGKNGNVEFLIAAFNNAVGGISTDTANLLRLLYDKAAYLIG